MVNIQKYQDVSIGDTVEECQKDYISKLASAGTAIDENAVTKKGDRHY